LTRKAAMDWGKYIAESYNLKLWLNGLVAPFNEAGISTWNELHFISHIGYLTLLCIIPALLLLSSAPARNQVLVFTGCAAFALMWSGDTFVTSLIYYLPLFNKLRLPFKLQLFTSFYMIAVAAFGFDLISRRLASLKSGGRNLLQITVPLLLLLHILNLVGIHTFSREYSFTKFVDRVPFDEPLKVDLSDGRIVSIIQKDINENSLGKAEGFTTPLIGYDYATLWGLYHIGGHDSLVPEENFSVFEVDYDSTFKVRQGSTLDEELNNSLEYFRLWGVRWYIADGAFPVSKVAGLKLFSRDAARTIYYDSGGLPFAFWSDSPAESGIVSEFSTNSVQLDTNRPSDGVAVLNVLWNPYFSAVIDGEKVKLEKANSRQIKVSVPSGKHLVRISYYDPNLIAGMIISLFTIIALSGYGYRIRRTDKSGNAPANNQPTKGSA
ncbi:MAG: YfhO family protein, partial [Desulfuromonadaceae bacterium]|nr:YfhO family protein [Desulfuromonadaceae bacterium]